MLSVRRWPAHRLIFLWIVTSVTLVSLRWTLNAGTYRGVIESREVTELVGLWPPVFASIVMPLGTVLAAVTLVWVTVTWVGSTTY
ncbi:MAG: hypothetical protein ACKVIN_14825, partial [Longimicrobiales bacterium]